MLLGTIHHGHGYSEEASKKRKKPTLSKETNSSRATPNPQNPSPLPHKKNATKLPITPPKASSIQYHHHDSSSKTPIVAFFQLPTNSSSSSPYCGSLEDLIHLQEKKLSSNFALQQRLRTRHQRRQPKSQPKNTTRTRSDVTHFLRSHGDEFRTFFLFLFFGTGLNNLRDCICSVAGQSIDRSIDDRERKRSLKKQTKHSH